MEWKAPGAQLTSLPWITPFYLEAASCLWPTGCHHPALPTVGTTRTLDENIEVLVILASHIGGHTQVSARVRHLCGLDLEQPPLPQDTEPLAGGHRLGDNREGPR